MLADRPRVRWAIEISALLAVIGVAYVASARTQHERIPEQPPVVETAVVETTDYDSAPVVHSDTLIVYLRDVPEWTGVEEESDWAKSYRMIWDGPIQTWTTMREIRVPSLNHRMIESIEPVRGRCGDVSKNSRAIVVKVRVVVPGDLEAALEWIRSNPDVERADVR